MSGFNAPSLRNATAKVANMSSQVIFSGGESYASVLSYEDAELVLAKAAKGMAIRLAAYSVGVSPTLLNDVLREGLDGSEDILHKRNCTGCNCDSKATKVSFARAYYMERAQAMEPAYAGLQTALEKGGAGAIGAVFHNGSDLTLQEPGMSAANYQQFIFGDADMQDEYFREAIAPLVEEEVEA